MGAHRPAWTAEADLVAVLDQLLGEVRVTLGAQLVGLYLAGSLALGDFNLERSDVDFAVVTEGDLDEARVAALAVMHGRIAAGPSRWARQLEGVYLPRAALRGQVPTACFPSTHEGRFYLGRQGGDGVILRHVLRGWGVALTGPAPRTMIDPVGPDDLRQAVRAILAEWWRPQLADHTLLRRREYQAYAVLTMCRIRYTLAHGEVASKPVAARWAGRTLARRWSGLIEWALAWPRGPRRDELHLTVALIRATVWHGARDTGSRADAESR